MLGILVRYIDLKTYVLFIPYISSTFLISMIEKLKAYL